MSQLQCTGFPPQQSETLWHAAMGHSVKVTARFMDREPRTVKAHRAAVMLKLGAKNTTEAVAKGFKRGHLKYIPILFICLTSLFGMSNDMRPVRRPARSVSVVRVISSRPAA